MQTADASISTCKIATEAGFLQSQGIDTVAFGTGDLKQAHTANERIEIKAISEYKDILGQTLKKR